MRLVALDFETTGTVRGFANEPWQLGLVEIEGGRVLAHTKWETYLHVDPLRPFSPRAPGRWAQLRETLNAAPALTELWPELAAKVVGVPLVAHNAATERTVLVKCAPLTPFGPWVDTLALVRKYWPILKSYALGDLIKTFSLEVALRELCRDRTWHDALFDACAGALLYCYVAEKLKLHDFSPTT